MNYYTMSVRFATDEPLPERVGGWESAAEFGQAVSAFLGSPLIIDAMHVLPADQPIPPRRLMHDFHLGDLDLTPSATYANAEQPPQSED